MESIGDAWSFSGKTPIAPSGGFSVETLTGVTPSWKTELNRSISVVEDRISGGLQHCHETCCEKGGRRGRRACMVRRWFSPRRRYFRTDGLVYDTYAKSTHLENTYLQYIPCQQLKPTFHSSHLTYNTPYGSGAIVQFVFYDGDTPI